jgi:ZIP family zinc transporter/zinc and cadmium transporter
MSPIVYALLSALANVAGALAVAGRARRGMLLLDALIAVAAGFMISLALTELVPEALARGGTSAPVIMLAGYLTVHFTQHTLATHFHFGEETHSVTTAISMSALVGLLMHTFVDGVAIAAGFSVDPELGVLVFIAVVLHKFPEGLAIASLFLAAGQSPRRAVAAAGALGLTTLFGVAATGLVGPLADNGLPLAAGVTLYVAASNLVPEFQSKRRWSMALYFFGGCVLFTLAGMALG